MQLKHNILKMYLLKGVLWFMVSMPIIVLFFQSHGLSLTEIMLLQSAYSLSLALFEIPSGYIADSFGRKNSIVIGTILTFIGYLIFSFYYGFYTFIIAEILLGIGGSLISGADSALIYDTLLETREKNSYTKIEGKNYAIGNFSEAIAGILCGFLVVSSIYLPIYIQTGIIFLSIPIGITLVEPRIYTKYKLEKSYKSMIKITYYSFIKNKRLRWLIIYSSAMGVATLTMAWFSQPFFKEVNLPLKYFGLIWAGLNIVTGIASIRAHKFYEKYPTNKSLINISIVMSILFISLGLNINIYGFFFIILIYILRGIITPILRNLINLNTNSEKRATVLSIRSFTIRVSFAVFAPILGSLAENDSLSLSFYFVAFFVAVFSILSSYKLLKLD